MKFDLDLLRSRHVLLGMFLGHVFNTPSLSCTSPTNGPSNGSKTVKTGQKSRSQLRPGPHISGRGLTVAEFSGRGLTSQAGASRWQNASLPITLSSGIRLLHRFFSMKAMILLFILLPRNLHNTTLKNIKNTKSLRPFHHFKSKRKLPSGYEIHLSHPQT